MSTSPASFRDRLRQLVREEPQAFQSVLVRYGVERLLFRLSVSAHANRFVLKGAQVLLVYQGAPHRPTKDLDLLALGDDDVDDLASVFRDVCNTPVESDGLTFHPTSVNAETIRESARDGGVRVKLLATLDRARIPLQVDVGFGDVVTPPADRITFPTLLDGAAPTMRGYPLATVIAEKLESLTLLGLGTSRMKDLYDLWHVLRTFDVPTDHVRDAISATFERRGTRIEATPVALTSAFWDDASKRTQWRAFLTRNDLGDLVLEDVIRDVAARLAPMIQA